MRKEKIFTMDSPFREQFKIYGFRFGSGKKSVAIVGCMRGDEMQQQFVCSQLVKKLTVMEAEGRIAKDHEILVIPSVNPFSMNIGSRFWPMDNTDINRMFPGYDKGETTQRIADALFRVVSEYEIGIQLTSFYLPGDFIPHVRIYKTAVSYEEKAHDFGLPYIYVKTPTPFDSTLLNYNWQIWDTEAYSIYSGTTNTIDHRLAKQSWQAVFRFLFKRGIVKGSIHSGMVSDVITDQRLKGVVTPRAGILYSLCSVGDDVQKGDQLAKILDPYDGSILSEIDAPMDGTIFFAYNRPLVNQHKMLYNILKR